MKRLLHTILALSIAISSTLCYSAHIFFDFDGVLSSNDRWATMRTVGFTKFIGNPLRMLNIKKTLFQFLSTVEPRTEETPFGYHQGLVMPQIMCDWQTGVKTSAQIRTKIAAHVRTPRAERFFKKYGGKDAVIGLCNFMFDPEQFASTVDLIADGVALLQKCKAAGHKVYILSNYSQEAFMCVLAAHNEIKKLCELCDGICLSGDLGVMKPDPEIFVRAFARYNIDPDTEMTFFFDDEKVNVAAAQMLDKKMLHAAQIKNKKFDKAYALLKKHNLL